MTAELISVQENLWNSRRQIFRIPRFQDTESWDSSFWYSRGR